MASSQIYVHKFDFTVTEHESVLDLRAVFYA